MNCKEEIGKTYEHLNVCEDILNAHEAEYGVSLATPIYRYLPEEWYLELIETKVNKLAHVTKWDDPFEAFVLRSEGAAGYLKLLKGIYGQCWTLYGEESDVRWRAYGSRGKVVRIESTVGALIESLKSLPMRVARQCYIGRVGYVEESQLNKYIEDDSGDSVQDKFVSSMFIKRKEFSEEMEFRVVVNLSEDDKSLVEVTEGLLNVHSADFIKAALFDPCMSNQRVEEIKCRSLSADVKIDSKKSTMFHRPDIKRPTFPEEVAFDNSYAEFWEEFAGRCKEMANRKRPTRHWWCYDTRQGAAFNYVVTHKYARVELYIDSGDREQNVSVYESLKEHENEMRQQMGSNIEFEALEKKRAKRVKVELTGIDMTNRTNWPRAIKFLVENMPKFVSVIDKYLPNGRAN